MNIPLKGYVVQKCIIMRLLRNMQNKNSFLKSKYHANHLNYKQGSCK